MEFDESSTGFPNESVILAEYPGFNPAVYLEASHWMMVAIVIIACIGEVGNVLTYLTARRLPQENASTVFIKSLAASDFLILLTVNMQ